MKRFSLGRILQISALSGCLLFLPMNAAFATDNEGVPEAPVPGKVTMLDLGAKNCIPCKMMMPIMADLEKEYKDKAAIVFIDIWEHPGAGQKYGVMSIPTQIFYNTKGKETFRHVGFMEKADIIAELQKLGVK